MEGSYRLVVEDAPPPADLALLEDRVAEAARSPPPALVTTQEFGIFVRDDDGRVVAGVSGIVWGGCCELQAMWVDEPLRGRGLARALMAGAEEEARRRGCTLVQFRAYDVLVGRPLRAARLRDRRRDRGLPCRQRRPLVPQGSA